MGVAEDFDFLPVAPAVGGENFDLVNAASVTDGVASGDESVAGNFREVVGVINDTLRLAVSGVGRALMFPLAEIFVVHEFAVRDPFGHFQCRNGRA